MEAGSGAEAFSIQVYARVRPPAMKSVNSADALDGASSTVLGPTGKGNLATPAKGRPPKQQQRAAPESAMKATSAANGKTAFSSMRIGPQDGALGLPNSIQFDLADGTSAALDETTSSHSNSSKDTQTFDLDAVFPPHIDQKTVFDILGAQHVANVVAGFNSTVFAYGRTCSGKTHTIVGPAAQRYGNNWTFAELEAEAADPAACPSALGLVPRALHALLARINEHSSERHFTLRFACAEIYNQKLFDLCSGSGADGSGAESGAGGRSEVRDGKMTTSAADRISWHDIDVKGGNEGDAMLRAQQLICRANAARVHASTAANMDSSRSHVLYLARVSSVGQEGDCREAMLSIVDLAGSESLDTGRDKAAPGSGNAAREHETRAINSSLHTLTRVVHAYATAPAGGKPAHVPYRESLLTLLLKDSIGGNCMTSIVVALSADEEQLVHSYKSCQFARLARGVRNVVKENKHYDPGNVIASLRAKVAELQEGLASRDAAAAAESCLGPRLGSLLSMSPAPDFPLDRVIDVVAQWVDTAAAAQDENGGYEQEEDQQAAYDTRVQALAALSKALAEYVQSTGVPTQLDKAETYESGVGTSPWMARGRMVDTAAGTGVQGGSPTLLKRQDMTAAVDPASIRSSVLTRMLSDTETWLGRVKTTVLPMLKCAAGVLEKKMTAVSATRSAAGEASSAGDARLTISAVGDDPVLGMQRDYSRVQARIETLEAEVAAAEARLEAMQALAEGKAVAAGGAADGGEASTSSTASATSPASPARLPPSSSFEWQAWSESEQEWQPLSEELSAALQRAAEAAGAKAVLVGPDGKLKEVPAAEVRTVPVLPATRPSKAAGTPLHVVAGSEDMDSLASATYPAAAVRPFAGNVAYTVHTDGRTGTQTCSITGATVALRLLVLVVAQGDLSKRSKWTGAWVPRTMRLTPAGFVQLYDANNRKLARSKVQSELGSKATPSAVRHALARASVDKVKARFSEAEAVAVHTPTADNEGREFMLKVTPKAGSTGSARTFSQTFCASSAHEALLWVGAVNAAAAGAFMPAPRPADAAAPASAAPTTSASASNADAGLSQLTCVLDAVTAARVKEAATRSTRLSFDSDAMTSLTTPLVPPARSLGLLCKELGLSWALGTGEAPCGTTTLVPVGAESMEWAGLVEPLAGDLARAEAWAAAAGLRGIPAAAAGQVYTARVRRVLRVQCAVLAQRFLGLCAEHRYRQGRKSLAAGHAFGLPDSGAELGSLLTTVAATDGLFGHLAASVTAAAELQSGRVRALLAAIGVPGSAMAPSTAGKASVPVVVYRVAYSTAAATTTAAGPSKTSGAGPFSPAPVRRALSDVLTSPGPAAPGHSAAVGAAMPAAPPAAPAGPATSVRVALERPEAVIALYPAYVLLLSLEQAPSA